MRRDPIYCRVCGLSVDPKEDILFGAFGKPLFAVHRGKCEQTVNNGVSLVGRTFRGLLQQKAPRAAMVLETVIAASRKVQDGQR